LKEDPLAKGVLTAYYPEKIAILSKNAVFKWVENPKRLTIFFRCPAINFQIA
jgi:hypothetical protein